MAIVKPMPTSAMARPRCANGTSTGAAAIADPSYALAALLAGFVLALAATLLVGLMRSKSVAGTGGSQDASRAASDDAAPGIGIDRETPLGDTSEHSDAERVAKPASARATAQQIKCLFCAHSLKSADLSKTRCLCALLTSLKHTTLCPAICCGTSCNITLVSMAGS